MALKAGYYGIKKSVLGIINTLASAKIIKEIGKGLDLTDNEISVDINTSTMEFIGNKLSAKGGDTVLSTDEFDNHELWIDGKKIFGKVLTNVSIPQNQWGAAIDLGVKVSTVINHFVVSTDASGANSPGLVSCKLEGTDTSTLSFISGVTSFSNAVVVVYYTKVS